MDGGAAWVLLAEPAALLVALLAIGWALTSRPRGRGR